MSLPVYNFTVYDGNPYHKLLFGSIEDRYYALKSDLGSLDPNESRILHIHWEEHGLRRARTRVEAESCCNHMLQQIGMFKRQGGSVVWTVHNESPHELEHVEVFRSLRLELAVVADRILVHNLHSIARLRDQGITGLRKIFYLPHPSYDGAYPQVGRSCDKPRAQRLVLFFGMIRRYKNLEFLLETIHHWRSELSGLDFVVAGTPLEGDDYSTTLRRKYSHLSNVNFDFSRVPDEDVPRLFADACCLVLPYERYLTSGAALLGLTMGSPLIAPNCPQMKELLPSESWGLLFEPGSRASLMEKMMFVANASEEELQIIAEANRERADDFKPHAIGSMLAGVYDSLLW